MSGFGPEDAEALAVAARHAIAWRDGVASRPVVPRLTYPEALAGFTEPLPAAGLPGPAVIEDLVRRSDGGLAGMISPNFHGWVMGASHPAGVAADWLAAAWGQAGLFTAATPAAAAVEEVATGWIRDLLGLPPGSGVGVTTGATMANLIGLGAARNALLARAGWDVEASGLFGAPEIHVVVGGEAHSSLFLSLRLLGFGAARVHVAAADAEGRMRPEALAEVLDTLDGPVLVCLQAGNVNSGAFDSFAELIPLARAREAWVHVDGAFGIWAAAVPSLRPLARGLEAADSWAVDGHKWLQVPYDCGIAIVRDSAAMQRAMGVRAAYLAHSEAFREPESHSPEMSRRARGFALWAVLKALGRDGLVEMVERHCAVARAIAARLAAEPGLAVLNEVVLNQVVVACGDGPDADALTGAVLAAVQAEGVAYPSGGRWRDRAIIRVSVSAGPTTVADGERSADAIIAAWRRIGAAAA